MSEQILKIIDDGMKKRDRSVLMVFDTDGTIRVNVYPYPEEVVDIFPIKEARESLGRCLSRHDELVDLEDVWRNMLSAASNLDKFLKRY